MRFPIPPRLAGLLPIGSRPSAGELAALSRAQEELRRQTAYLDGLFELAPHAVVLGQLNPNRVIRVNREFTAMFGYSAEEAVGSNLPDLIAPGELQDGFTLNADAIAAGDKTEAEGIRQRKDGSRIHVHLTAAPVRPSDGALAACLIYRDITEAKRAADALRESEARFRSLADLSSDWYWRQDEN